MALNIISFFFLVAMENEDTRNNVVSSVEVEPSYF